jgi:hypothetical protein
VTGSYSTPYTVFTTATFVATGGTPSYYLQLQQTIANIDPTESYSWGFELAAYAPYTFSNYVSYPASCTSSAPCAAASTPHLVGGVYPNTSLTGGLAVYIAPGTYLLGYNSQVFVDAGADNVNDNQSTHLFDANWTLPPSSSRTFTWYVMAGNWTPALSFALSHGLYRGRADRTNQLPRFKEEATLRVKLSVILQVKAMPATPVSVVIPGIGAAFTFLA